MQRYNYAIKSLKGLLLLFISTLFLTSLGAQELAFLVRQQIYRDTQGQKKEFRCQVMQDRVDFLEYTNDKYIDRKTYPNPIDAQEIMAKVAAAQDGPYQRAVNPRHDETLLNYYGHFIQENPRGLQTVELYFSGDVLTRNFAPTARELVQYLNIKCSRYASNP